MSILEVKNLSVKLDGKEIIKNINFSLNEGEILLVIGPNGGGKTTLLKAILKIIPYDGEVIIKNNYKIGYLPQNIDNISKIPIVVFEMFKFFTDAKKEKIYEVLEFFNLTHYKNELFKNLSGGLKQRVLIALSILTNSKILLLDEPTNNLDLNAQNEFYNLIKKLKEEYRISMIIVSHDIGIVNAIADNVLCLNRVMFYHGKPNLTEKELCELYGNEVKLIIHAH
ncbi:MAG: metal ABC transporter ATP-binding protein [Candidatus Hydrothermia bacterium]|jgi:zinc transport system ATP-binding protein